MRAKILLLLSYAFLMACVSMPGCHGIWGTRHNPTPVSGMILFALLFFLADKSNFQSLGPEIVAMGLSTWSMLLTPLCFTPLATFRWIPKILAILLALYWIPMLRNFFVKQGFELFYGYYCAGIAYTLASIACILIGTKPANNSSKAS
jgi:hypothetical protein